MPGQKSQSRFYIQPKPGEVEFNLFGPVQKKDIRVGYIDPDRGYVTGATICEANAHAKLNPGSSFILNNRDSVRFLNINEVNDLTPSEAFDSTGVPGNSTGVECEGVTINNSPESPTAEFMGGGGVGVKGNPIIGKDGSVLGVHLVERGFGYKYAPLVDIKDKFGPGAGVVAYSILAPEVNRGWEFYESKSDVEDYYPIDTKDGTNIQTLCSDAASEVPYGYTYTVAGERTNEWDPTIYANLTEDLFRRRILAYQEYLDSLRSPWFATRYKGDMLEPSKVSSDGGLELNPDYIFEKRQEYSKSLQGVYAVQHPGWGSYDLRNLESDIANGSSLSGSTNKDVADVEFEVFVHVLKNVVNEGFRFQFTEVINKDVPPEMGRYGPDTFTIRASDVDNTSKNPGLWESGSIKKITKKIRIDTLYEVKSIGSHAGKKTEQGLVNKLGRGAKEIANNTSLEKKAGKFIFADLVATVNDDDDMQIGATVGEFTQENMWRTHDGVTKNEPQSHLTINPDGTWTEKFETKGHSSHDLFYKVSRRELEGRNGVTDDKLPTSSDGAITQSFMNKYAISPVPMSNATGSDFANQLFTLEWDLLFPYPGEYTFIGQTDNVCKFYLDGQLIADLSKWNTAPLVIKKTLGWTIDDEIGDNGKMHNVRLDLLNEPLLEDTILQQDDDGKVYLAAEDSDFQDVEFDAYSHVIASVAGWDLPPANANEVTFTSTSAAGCTNRFYVVERGAPAPTNNIEWMNMHSRNFPLSNRLNRNKTGITFLDEHGGDSNGWANITSGNAKFSDDASKLVKIGSGSNTVTIKYGWKDGGRNHGDGFVINGVEWNNKAAGYSDRGSITKDVELGTGSGFKELMMLERDDKKTVELKDGVDYGVYFTTTCNTDPMGCEITDNGTRILIEDLGVRTPTDDMVVTIDKGRFRSKDGTDDWGLFGHPNHGQLKDQILWSMPKIQPGTGIKKSPPGLQFEFTAKDGTHSFNIRSKDIQAPSVKNTSIKKIKRLMKVNTVYRVQATRAGTAAEIEQGLVHKLGHTGGGENRADKKGKYIFADVLDLGGNDDDDIQLGATKGEFVITNKHIIPSGKRKGGDTYDIEYEYKVERVKPLQATPSTASSIKTKNVFDTATYQNDANRQLWRTNIYNRGGFLAKYGVCPFNVYEEMDNLELNDNPYAGDHKIIWNNINFPVSANYTIRVAVDDSVTLEFEGPNETVRLSKNGFHNGKSTGDSKYSQWFDKGSYKLTAVLHQIEGGRFGFKKLTEAEKAERRQRIFDKTFVPLPPPPTTSEVKFTTTSSAGFTNSVSISELGTLTRNASMTKTVEIGKNYNVAFSSSGGNDRVRLKLSSDKRTVFMEDLTDGDFNDLVLKIDGGKFKSITNNRFLTYEGGMSTGGAGGGQQPEPLFPSSPDDIKIKGLNPMALSVEIKVSYAEGTLVKQQSWYENPMGVAFNIRAPLAPPPQQEEPKSEGRCPNNPLWTTRFTTNSENTWYPCYSKLSSDSKVDPSNDWGDFMNEYAMSPVPPRSNKGTDEGGKWFSNTWKVSIPYKGFYTFKMCADDQAEFYVDGVEVMKSSNWKIPKEKMFYIEKEMDEIAEFEVRVKNKSTTRMMRIDEKVFSARDWVKEGGATDEGFKGEASRDPHQIRKVKFDLFSHVLKQWAYGQLPPTPDTLDVTFTSTSAAGCTNRFYLVERGAPADNNRVVWKDLHPRNNPISSRIYDNGTKVCLLDHHGNDCNANITITSGNARFSDDGSRLIKLGGGSNVVTITYQWKDHGRDHGDGLIIFGKRGESPPLHNSTHWDPGGGGLGDKGSLTKTIEIYPDSGDGFKELAMLERNASKKVTLKSGVDYGCYFTTTCNTDPMGCEITDNGTKIAIEDLRVAKPTDDMVVTITKGKFRSKDGTDDTGLFGHPNNGKLKDQILFNIPKIESGSGIPDPKNPSGLRAVFKEKGGKHEFVIRADELKDIGGAGKGIHHTGDNRTVTKDVKLNTEYDVVISNTKKSSGGSAKTKCEQGLIKKLGRDAKELNPASGGTLKGKYIFGDVLDKDSANDNDDIQIGATEGMFTVHSMEKIPGKIRRGGSNYKIKYKIEWEPPQTQAKNLTASGSKKDGIIYKGPYLFSYLEKDWGDVMNKLSVACIDDKNQELGAPNENILGTKTLTWTNVPFKHEGDYDIVFMGDDEAKFYINNELVLNSKWGEFGDQHAKTRSFSITTPGNYDIKVEVDNTATHSNIFYDNPTGVVLEITKPLDLPTYDVDGVINSDSWQKNPMGVSMECVPPPCPKLETGIGQVGDVIITEPGNKFKEQPSAGPGEGYDVVNNITDWVIIDKGTNYSEGDVLEIEVPGSEPITTQLKLEPFGGIKEVVWPPPPPPDTDPPLPPPPGITTYPSFRIGPPGTPPPTTRTPDDPTRQPPPTGIPPKAPTGVNAKVVPVITPTVLLPDGIDPRTGLQIPSNQLIQVTDLVGLKQTGWYNGKEYYGAVFYKDGVRYAGYYETAGVLIRVYSTKQESIDSQVTTPPSAILRQGTDVSSNDPRLNIPGTPQ